MCGAIVLPDDKSCKALVFVGLAQIFGYGTKRGTFTEVLGNLLACCRTEVLACQAQH